MAFVNIVKIEKNDSKTVVNSISQIHCWSIKNTNIPSTWSVTKGQDMIGMVIDTGHPNHKDIGDNATEGKNFTTSSTILDTQGHASHVMGVICAKDNHIGMVGVAPKAKCISVKGLGDDGSGQLKWVENALEYAVQVKPDVICMSLGAPVGSARMHKLIKTLYKMNIPIVCAAGNDGYRGVDYPAKYPETIAVAAFDRHGRISDFSARGPELDFAAPGVDIYSTWLNNKYIKLNGTSMACPYIAGVILLLLSKHRIQEELTGKNDCKTVDEVKTHLLKYTVDKGTVGRDQYWGYGVVDVEALIVGKSECIETIDNFKENRKWYNRVWKQIKRFFR
jgi:minor extracellular protease Epr